LTSLKKGNTHKSVQVTDTIARKKTSENKSLQTRHQYVRINPEQELYRESSLSLPHQENLMRAYELPDLHGHELKR